MLRLDVAEGLAIIAPVPTVPVQQGRRVCGVRQILALDHLRKFSSGKVAVDDVVSAFLLGAKIGVVGRAGYASPRCWT